MIREANGQFTLIDLEQAGVEGVVDYKADAWAELQDGKYTKQMDLMMLAIMISRYEAYLDMDGGYLGREFRARLMGGWIVEEAIMDPWLNNN